MKTASHTSFSVLGLSIVFILGGIIIVLELILEPILRCIQRRRNIALYQRLEWVTTETLQLQRMAHEGLGAGTWEGTTESVPFTAPSEPLARLNVSDKTHPRLVYEAAVGDKGKPTASEGRPHSSSLDTTTADILDPVEFLHYGSPNEIPDSPIPSISDLDRSTADEIYQLAMLPISPPMDLQL